MADTSGQDQRPPISEVLGRHADALMDIPGVIGTGEGLRGGVPVIVVYVAKEDDRLRREVPAALEGYPVDVRPIGEVTAPPK